MSLWLFYCVFCGWRRSKFHCINKSVSALQKILTKNFRHRKTNEKFLNEMQLKSLIVKLSCFYCNNDTIANVLSISNFNFILNFLIEAMRSMSVFAKREKKFCFFVARNFVRNSITVRDDNSEIYFLSELIYFNFVAKIPKSDSTPVYNFKLLYDFRFIPITSSLQ